MAYGREFSQARLDGATAYRAVTPSDASDLAAPCRGIYVGVAGDVRLAGLDGEIVTLKSVAAGVEHGFQARRIYSTGTTATDIVALY